jgi:hypothetical protein
LRFSSSADHPSIKTHFDLALGDDKLTDAFIADVRSAMLVPEIFTLSGSYRVKPIA